MRISNDVEARGTIAMIAARLAGEGPQSAEEWEAVRGAAWEVGQYARQKRNGAIEAEASAVVQGTGPLHLCAGKSCPGLPWKASERGHPESCAVDPGAGKDERS